MDSIDEAAELVSLLLQNSFRSDVKGLGLRESDWLKKQKLNFYFRGVEL